MRNQKNGLHYNEQYFLWQKRIGEFGGWANLSKFSSYIKKSDDVLDFGCGGGYLLKQIDCQRRVGVEPNLSAAETASQNGIELHLSTEDIPDDYVNVIISNNALEHTLRPLDELKSLYPIIKVGGKVIFVVPCEAISYRYKPDDINRHLYSWSPMSIGNLFKEAGFSVIESKPFIHKWPPKYQYIAKFGGRALFDMVCFLYGRIERTWFQIRIIAQRISV
jgi:SAM-dependent methyltransferase